MPAALVEYRDNAGLAAGSFTSGAPWVTSTDQPFATEVVNAGSWSKASATVFECVTAGSYLVLAKVRFSHTANLAYPVFRARLESVSGSYSYFTSEAGRTAFKNSNINNDITEGWVPVHAYLHNVQVGDQFKIVSGMEGTAATISTVIGNSEIQILPIEPRDAVILKRRHDTSNGNLDGSTPEDVYIDDTVLNTNNGHLTIVQDALTPTTSVRVDTDGLALVLGTLRGGGSPSNRTGRRIQLVADNGQKPAVGYCYARISGRDSDGVALATVVRRNGTNVSVKMQGYMPAYTLDNAGVERSNGWDINGSTTVDQEQLCVLMLPANAKAVAVYGTAQTLVTSSQVELPLSVEEFRDGDTFNALTSNGVGPSKDLTVVAFAHALLSRSGDLLDNTRAGFTSQIEVNGVAQVTGQGGTFSPGDDGANGVLGSALSAHGVFSVSSGQSVKFVANRYSTGAGDGERTQPDTTRMVLLDAETLVASPTSPTTPTTQTVNLPSPPPTQLVPYQHRHHILLRPNLDEFASSLLLADQRLNMPRLEAFARALGAGAQVLETLLYSILVGTSLEGAEGVHLERWGKLVGEQRGGLTDARYREFIELRARVNTSPDDTSTFKQLLTDAVAPLSVQGWPMYPAGAQFEISGGAFIGDVERSHVAGLLRDLKPAGVAAPVVQRIPNAFTFSTVLGTPNTPLSPLIFDGR